jgi:DNA-binding NtrC family response regulator
MRIIWVDDDSFGILSVIEKRFRRNGLSVERFRCYEDAENFINQRLRPMDTFLIDFILPSKEVKVSAFLGLVIAQLALEKNVKNITFLSVVSKNEVQKDLDKLKEDHPDFNYEYFNKAELVGRGIFENLITSLKRQ